MNNNLKIFNNNIDIYFQIITEELSKTNGISELGKYVKIQGGYSFKASEYKTAGIPIIRISDFNNGKIILDGVKYYEEKSKFNDFLLNSGDIIIAMTGGTIGKLAIVQENLGKLYLNQRVGRFQILENDKIYNEYLYWIARGVENIVKNMGYGGAQPNVSGKQIESIKFVFPKIEVQKNIVNFLNDLKDGKLENKEYFNKDTEQLILNLHNKSLDIDLIGIKSQENISYIKQLKQVILQEAIEGKLTKSWRENNPGVESASVLLEKIKKEKDELVKQKKLKKQEKLKEISEDEIPFEIPESWSWCRLGEICNIVRGGSPRPAGDPQFYNGTIPFLKVGDLTRDSNKFLYDYTYTIKEAGLYKTRYVEGNTLMLTNSGGTLGIPKICTFSTTFNDGIAAFIYLSSNLNIEYLYLILKTKSTWFLEEAARGQGQPNLNTDIIGDTIVSIPPLEEQKEIVKKIDEMMKLCDELEKQSLETKENSKNLMKSVLNEVFSR